MGLILFGTLINLEPLGVLPSNSLFSRVFLLVVIFCACFVVPVFGTCNCLWFSMDSTVEMLKKIIKFMESRWPLLDPAKRFSWLQPHKGKSRQPNTRGSHQVRFGEGRCMQPYPQKQTGYFHNLSPWPPNRSLALA